MRFQPQKWACGPTAVVNALEALGRRVYLRAVTKDCGATADKGVTEHGLLQALERAGAKTEVLNAGWDEAHERLLEHLREGGSAVLLLEAGAHWAAAIGVIGRRVVVFNSERTLWNARLSGVHVLAARQLSAWWCPYEGRRYALLVNR